MWQTSLVGVGEVSVKNRITSNQNSHIHVFTHPMSGGQAIAEIWLELIEYTRCLGITWNAQTKLGTFCD